METERKAAAERSGFSVFFDSVIGLVVMTVLAAGVAALARTWSSSEVEFMTNERLQVTRSEWWGLIGDVQVFRATQDGWVLMRENGDEVAVTSRPILLRD